MDEEKAVAKEGPPRYWKVTLRRVQNIKESHLGSTKSEVHKIPIESIEVVAKSFCIEGGWIHFSGCLYDNDWGCNIKDFDEYEVEEYHGP